MLDYSLPLEVYCTIVPGRRPVVKTHTRKVDGHNAIHLNLGNSHGIEGRGGELWQLVGVDGSGTPVWTLLDMVD